LRTWWRQPAKFTLMSCKREFDEGVEKKGLRPKFLVDTYFEQKRQPLEVRSQGPDRLTTFGVQSETPKTVRYN